MRQAARLFSLSSLVTLLALLSAGAAAGFFFAYAASVMWGLDDAPAQSAIEAMQGINRLVRNPVFFAVFFGTAALLLLASISNWIGGAGRAAGLLLLAALLYIGGVIVFTGNLNVPMNEALAGIDAASDPQGTWSAFSPLWQTYNWIRMWISFLVLALAAVAYRIG